MMNCVMTEIEIMMTHVITDVEMVVEMELPSRHLEKNVMDEVTVNEHELIVRLIHMCVRHLIQKKLLSHAYRETLNFVQHHVKKKIDVEMEKLRLKTHLDKMRNVIHEQM